MHSRSICDYGRLLLAALVVVGCLAFAARDIFSPRPLYYRTLKIDLRTMIAELSDPFPGRHEPKAEYYSTFRGMAHLSIYHYDGSKKLPYRVRYTAFEADFDQRIGMRSMWQELLTGPYGTVYSQTSYFYGIRKGSKLVVMVWANKAEHEPMQVVDESPSRTSQLDAISLVRVFHISDWSPKLGRIKEYAVITAVYSQDGKLLRAGAFGSRGGDWHQDLTGEIQKEHGSLSSLRPEAKKKYGLPDHFPIADYLERRQWEWNEVGKPNPENVINLHYDYNRWVRQDIFDAKGKRTMRYLTYVVTPEDKILEEIDRQVPFGQRKSE